MIRTVVVDDDFRVAALHKAYTEQVPGFVVVAVAGSGAEALEAVAEAAPDLVLLDIYLPDMSGLDVLRILRERGGSALDVIAITAARDVETLRSAMQGGVLHYLIKPFRFNAFHEKLQSYAALRSKMAKLSEAGQDDVDRLYRILWSGQDEDLPKGLSRPTLDLVGKALAESDSGLTAAEVGRRAGLSRVTARRYLDHLCRLGRVEVAVRYGSPGRPEHRYRRLLAPFPLREG